LTSSSAFLLPQHCKAFLLPQHCKALGKQIVFCGFRDSGADGILPIQEVADKTVSLQFIG
jgi:hypothetical protein